MSELARAVSEAEFETALSTRLSIGSLAVGQVCTLYAEVHTQAGFWQVAAAVDLLKVDSTPTGGKLVYTPEYEKMRGIMEEYHMVFDNDDIARNPYKGRVLRSFMSHTQVGSWDDSFAALLDSELTLSVK